MNISDTLRHGNDPSYNWEGVMEFLYNQYQNSSQKQNIWLLERNTLKDQIKELEEHKQRVEKQKQYFRARIKTDENKRSLEKDPIKLNVQPVKYVVEKPTHQSTAQSPTKEAKTKQSKPFKVPCKPIQRMLCSLGIPQLLQDIKKDLQHHQSQAMTSQPKTQGAKEGLQLNLSKIQADPKNSEILNRKLTYQVTCTLQGHHDGVRDVVFINYNDELKQIVSASEDSTLKVWQVKKDSLNRIQKAQCIQTIREHAGPIFTCVQGDGYVFTGGMEGIIRAYDFRKNSTDKRHLIMKWRTDQQDHLQPLWQLLYDKTNRLLISTASEMPIKAYKIPEIQQAQRVGSNLKIQPYCQFLYSGPKNNQTENFQQYIPTAVCLFNSNLVASYFNSSSLVSYDIETQRIVNQLTYKIQANLSANKLISHPRCIIGAYQDCNVRIFDDKKMIECFKAHKQPVMAISLNWNNANSLFSCSQDGYVRLWDIRKLKEHVWETLGHQRKNDQAAHCIQTNFDGITVSGGADSLLKIYSPVL